MQSGPAEQLDQQNSNQCSQAVKANVPDAGRSAGHKGLMIFIKTGETYAENPRQNKEPETSYSVNIKRKRDCYGKQAVSCHMGGIPDIIVDGFRFICQFVITFSGI